MENLLTRLKHLIDSGDFSEAIDCFHNLKNQGFCPPVEIIEDLGNLLGKRQHHELAKEVFEFYVASNPNDFKSYRLLSGLALIQRDWDEHLKWLDDGIENTNSLELHLKKVRFLSQKGKIEDSLIQVEKTIQRHGEERRILYTWAKCLLHNIRYDETIRVLNKMVDLGYKSRWTDLLYIQATIGKNQDLEASKLFSEFISSYRSGPPQNDKFIEEKVRLLETWQHAVNHKNHKKSEIIFGIGLDPSRNSWLTKALKSLGFQTVDLLNPITYKVLDLEDFECFEAFTNLSVSSRFEELFRLFPKAKFIYIKREIADWVSATKNRFRDYNVETTRDFISWLEDSDGFGNQYKSQLVYQRAIMNLYGRFPSWVDAYCAFDKRVSDFFKYKPSEQLLTIDMHDDEWDKLSAFLNRPKPKNTLFYINGTNISYQNHRNILVEEFKAIYFYIPKVACTSIKSQLAVALGMKRHHANGDKFINVHNPKYYPYTYAPLNKLEVSFKKYFKFAIVRNPLSRIISCFNDKILSDHTESQGFINGVAIPLYNCSRNFYGGMSFQEFVGVICSIPDPESDRHFRSQLNQLIDSNGNLIVDYIGKLESLDQTFIEIEKHTGLVLSSSIHLNKTKTKYGKIALDNQILDIIENRYSEDFKWLQYSLDREAHPRHLGLISKDFRNSIVKSKLFC